MNTHTQRSLPKVIQTLPYVSSESQNGHSLANEVTTDLTAEHKHAVSHMQSSRLALMLPVLLASQNLQGSQQDKTVYQDEMSRRIPPPPTPQKKNLHQ